MIIKDKAVLTLFFLFIGLVLIKAIFISFFPSPWIFSDEQSYFGMAEKIIRGEFYNIKNDHKPGYSLIISPALLMANIAQSYKAALIINILLSSCIIFASYIFFNEVFKIEKKESVFLAFAVSLLPQLFFYNYTVMSEALNIPLIYGIFVLLFLVATDKYKHRYALWIILGVLVGFSPIVRSQNLVLLVMFLVYCLISALYFHKSGKGAKNVIVSLVSAIATYSIFKLLIFTKAGSYSELREGYMFGIERSLDNLASFANLVHIFFGEISYFFIATLFVPAFLAVLYLNKIRQTNVYNHIIWFLVVYIIFNILLTTLHANYVYHNLGLKTIYSRYLDFIVPIVFSIGLVGILKYKNLYEYYGKQLYLFFAVTLILVLFLSFFKDNIFVNTFSIYIYKTIGDNTTKIVLLVVATSILFALAYNKTKLVITSIVALLLLTIIPAFKKQTQFSNDTFKYYAPIGYWFDKNNIRNSKIQIDKKLLSDSSSVDNSKYSDNARMDYVSFYSLLFWTTFYNNVETTTPELGKEYYIVSDELLPRKALAFTGPFILYDKQQITSIELSPIMLSRFAKGLNPPEEDWVWMNGDGELLIEKLLIPNVRKFLIEIQLKGLYPEYLNKQIEVFVNGISAGHQKCTDNDFNFSLEMGESYSITSILIKSITWDPSTNRYTEVGNGLGLDLHKITITYEQ